MDIQKSDNKIWLLGLIISTVVLYFGSFKWLLTSWLTLDAYSHGFLIPIISLFLIWQKRDILSGADDQKSPMLFILGLIIYVVGQFTGAIFLTTVSMIPFLLGLVLLFKGAQQMRVLIFPVCFLIFAIPLPDLDGIMLTLQGISTVLATGISHLLGVESSHDGCQILMNGAIFEVAPACSGFNSIVSLFTVVTLLAYLIPDPLTDKVILLIATLPLAIFTNGLRIAITLLVASNFGVEAGIRYFHDWGGITFFVIALVSIFILLEALRWIRKISTKL